MKDIHIDLNCLMLHQDNIKHLRIFLSRAKFGKMTN